MSGRFVKVCLNGHVYTVDRYVFSEDDEDYCPDCGREVIHQCRNCGEPIEGGSVEGKRGVRLPDYCTSCGEDYPWVDPVEAEKQRSGEFLNIDGSELNGHFYPALVYEINLCYQVKADQATLILTRKLIENLTVDSLRTVFGMEEMELFYDPDNHRTLPLSELVSNMKQRSNDLRSFSSAVDEELFRKIDELKYRGDASAHSIEENASNVDMGEKAEIATEVAKVLFRLRQEAKTAHRDR